MTPLICHEMRDTQYDIHIDKPNTNHESLRFISGGPGVFGAENIATTSASG
jgi:hypothetical protein